MKKINEALKKLIPSQIEALENIFSIPTSTNARNEIISRLQSFLGINSLQSFLTPDERRVLSSVYEAETGITFGEIEKKLKLDIKSIEKISDSLSEKLLIYILKNRQKLNNKLDKIYVIEEINEIINPLTFETITNHLKKISNILLSQKEYNQDSYNSIKDNKDALALLEATIEKIGIITLEEAQKIIPSQTLEPLLIDLKKKNIITIYHDLNFSSQSFIVLKKNIFHPILSYIQSPVLNHKLNIHNHYFLLNNLINTFDTISTFGLFLTKQKNFRKIDKKRLAESMLSLYYINGIELSLEDTSQLSLYLLYHLQCLITKGDSINISLKKIENNFEDPLKLLIRIINLLQIPKEDNHRFSPPFLMPSYKMVVSIIKLLLKQKECSYIFLQTSLGIKLLSEINSDEQKNTIQIRDNILSQFQIGLNILCITGIIEINDEKILLSDIGKEITSILFMNEPKEEEEGDDDDENVKQMYINPDFTLILPQKEIPSKALFNILTHTEIIKNDIFIHSRISKNSIVRANKRGMTQDKFISTLVKYSKNGIPQNLGFLINEWSNQIIRLKILNVTLLYTSHPSFIDEISYSELSECIIERISPNYVILEKEYLDKIIRLAQKNDIVISLFEEIQ